VGTPEEIDAELPQLLASYSEGHTTVLESLKELQEALAAAAKAAKDATAKAKTKTPAKPEKKDEGKTAPHPTKTAAGTAQAPDSFTLWDAADDANVAAAAVHADEPAAAPPAEEDELPAELPDGFDEGEAE